MRKRRKSGETLQNIISAAQREFAAKGFDGARVDSIARRAKINKAMIYYHFKSKKILYRAVFERTISLKYEEFDRILEKEINAKEKIFLFVDELFDMFSKHPEFVRMVLRELAAGPAFLAFVVSEFFVPIAVRFSRIIRQGMKSREFREVDSFLAYYHLISMIAFYFFTGPLRDVLSKEVTGIQFAEKFEREVFKKHLLQVLFNGILMKN